jgi:O-antigen ligase
MRSGHGRLISSIAQITEPIRRAVGRSFFFSWLGRLGIVAERQYRSGLFAPLSDREQGCGAWQFRLRQACMKGFEGSAALCFLQRVGRGFLDASVGSYGSFAFLYGVLSAAVNLGFGNRSYLALGICVLLIVSSVPVLHFSRSLGAAICDSLVLGWFLFDVCGLSKEKLAVCERGNDKTRPAFLIAFVLGAVSRVITPLGLSCFIVTAALVTLLFCLPELGLCSLFLLLPFFNILPHPTLILLAFVLMIELSWLCRVLCGRRRMRFGLIDALVLLLALQYALGGMIGDRRAFYAGLTSAALVLVWFPTVNLLYSKAWRKKAAVALCFSSLVTSFTGVLQFLLGKSELRWVDLARFSDIGGRVTSFFENPNVLAVYLLLTVPLALNLVIGLDASLFQRALGAFALVFGLLCLLWTWSRGAWLGMLLVILLFLILYSKESMALLLILVLPAGASLGCLPHAIRNRFSSIGTLTESSIRYRLYTWRGVLQMLAEHPFGVGVGEAAFSRAYASYAVSGTETVMHAHNLLLLVACELGCAGVLTFLLFLLCLLLCAIEKLYGLGIGDERLLSITCFCALSGVLVMGLFDNIWYHFGLMALFFAVSSMLTHTDGAMEGRGLYET